MKHKSSKRSVSNKHTHHRSYQPQARRLSTPNDKTKAILPNKIDLGTGTVHLDSHALCLKPNVPLKSQKLLKRDLLRCSNQRPSLLGPQTLQPPRVHHGSQQTHSVASSSTSSSFDHQHSQRRRSLSVNSHTFYATIDRIAPWPDISIGRLRSNGNELLRPLKNFRNIKNPRLFSPKYYAALSENTIKFKFHPSTRTYINEYRKQKGYLLNSRPTLQETSLSLTSSAQAAQSDDDQLSAAGTFSGGNGNCTVRERSALSPTDSPLPHAGIRRSANDILDNTNKSPIISSITNQINILPSIPYRHIRSTRHTHHPQTIALPSINASSLQYMSSMSSVEKTYGSENKKSSIQNQSKLYFLDGRQKKRISHRIKSDSEVTSDSQDYTELQTTSSPVVTPTQQPTAVVVYQLSRRTQLIAAQNDIESLILPNEQNDGVISERKTKFMDSSKPPRNDVVRQSSPSSLVNQGMERIVDNNTGEYTSILLNRRDGPLAHKLSIVANTNTTISSTNNHSLYKSPTNGADHFEQQEQVSPIACAWGFLPSPTEIDQSSDCQSITHHSTSDNQQNSPQKLANQKKADQLQSNGPSSNNLLLVTSDQTNEVMTTKTNSTFEQDEELEVPRIILQKIQFDDPAHYPSDLSPDLIKELLQERRLLENKHNSERSLRQRRSNNSSTTSQNSSPKKKRHRTPSDDDDDDDDDDEHQSSKKRIRRAGLTNENSLNNNSTDVMKAFHEKNRDRFARKALDIDANPHENTSYKRFIKLLDLFHDDYERHHDQLEETPDDHILDLLLSDHTLDEMSILSEKLKLSTYMSRVDHLKLKRLLEILSLRIKGGIEISPILKQDMNDERQETEEDERIWRDLVFERLAMCANACEIALNIMTTSNMPKEILIEHVIEHTTLFIKAQLAKTIFPEYDPLYRSDNQSKDPLLTKQKRSKVTGTKCKQVQILYNKIISLFQGIADLMPLGKFTDTIILAISSFAVSCIYVENIFDLQAHSLNILAELFSRYEHHRDSILDDLLLSIVRLPTSKKSLRCYRLPSGESIQMFTALIMHLVHSPVSTINSNITDTGNELHLLNTYTIAQNSAFKFLTLFFRSCGTKQGEDDYRIVFENFLADLLVTANRPEWPASEILLTLLSRILMTNFSNNSLPINIRLQSLDYLGSVAAQLRKDTIELDVLNSRENQDRLDQVIHKTLSSIEEDEDVMEVYKTDPLRYHRSLIIYLNELSQSEPTSHFAKMFHIGQWLRDVNITVERLTQTLTRRVKPNHAELVDDDIDESLNNNSKPIISTADEIELKKAEKMTILKMLLLPITARKQQRYTLDIEYDDICLLMRYLTSNRPFLKTFDVYLKQLAAVFQSEAGTNIRSKAMKCLCTVVEADPTILARNDIKSCVQVGLTDKSISVREAAIDLIGRYIVQKQQLILQYYDILCERSIDTGVSVRKRVVKIFRDVCLGQPDFVRIPDICSRLLRRIHDEESIRKLVLETFQQLWFTPIRNSYDIRQRVQTIIDVLIDAQKQNNTWLENLVKEFLQINDKQSSEDKRKMREQRKDVLKAIQDIINELVESILKIESANDQISSNKMVATFVALYALGKANPEHVLPHVSTIVEYLNIKCTSYNDNVIVQYVSKILEFTVPLMKSASSSIIYSLEGSLTKLLLVSGQLVIHSSIACLSAVIRLSKNTQLVKDVFIRYHSFIIQCQETILEKSDQELKGSAQLARSIYILGVLCKYFDVEKSEYDDLEFSIEDLFQLFMFFIQQPDSVVKLKSLVGLGYFLQRYGQYLVEDTVRQLYHTYLLDRRSSAGQLRCQVLINLEEYFRDCIRRMAEQDVDYLQTATNEDENSNDANTITGANLKDTADVHSEMASSIAQCYLRIVLDTYLSEDEIIRQCVRKVVTCILEQGLVHPVQFIPFLIAMTTDRDINIQQSAELNLQDLDKTNPGIIQTKVMQGLKMSYQLQKLLAIANNNQQSDPQSDVIRGMTKVAVTLISSQQLPYCSVNHFLYSLIRSSRVYRRGLITQLLKMFDNDATPSALTLDEQLFVADNLAYFPYQVQDEPLFIIEQIDLSVSVSGSTQLQQFRDLLKQHLDYIDDDEGIDMNKLEDKLYSVSETIIEELNQCLRQTKSTMLLLLLKSYLKDVYGLNDIKIIEYDNTECSKILDRPILSRKMNVKFEPKIILDTIKPIDHYDNLQKRKQLIKEFADFKRYLLAYDTDIEDTIQSISELLPSSLSTPKGKKRGSGSSKRRKVMIDSDDDSFDGLL